jgi:BASS family bile acid:Na+ symporter
MIVLFVKYTVMTSVILLMLAVGLRTEFGQVVAVAKNARLMSRGLIVNFIVMPVLLFVSVRWLPIHIDVKIGVMLMAAAPVAPMAPPFVGMSKGDVPYSVGLMTIVALLSVILTPLILMLALPATEAGLELNPWEIIKMLLVVQLIPIGIGMAIHKASPSWTKRLLKFVPSLGQIGLLVGVGFVLVLRAEQIISIGFLGFLVNLALVVVCLLVGDLGNVGESSDKRRSLAVSTAIRNIPLAFLIANSNYPGTAVAGVTLVFATFSMILSVVYGKLLLQREARAG